jgi:ubiquinone/menaquinone biosynthesis C-methylase UbiE
VLVLKTGTNRAGFALQVRKAGGRISGIMQISSGILAGNQEAETFLYYELLKYLMSTAIDPQKFKSTQRQGWDSVAEGWKRWWKVIEQGGQVVNDTLVELAKVSQGNRVLDIATGIGEPALTAARKAGPSGKVTAIDISPGMLAIARERAREAGLENIEFQEADAETFRLPNSRFDAIVSRFGLMFLPNLPNALRIMRDALADDGRIAAAVWSSPDKVPALSMPLGIVMKEASAPPPPPGSPGPFSLADAEILRQRFEQAGFRDINIEKRDMSFRLPSPEQYVDFVRSTAAPLNAMMAGLADGRKEEIWNKVVDAARRLADPGTGSINFSNQVVYVSAKR